MHISTISVTAFVTTFGKALLQKLTVAECVVKKLNIFYGTQNLITVFTTARHQSIINL